MELSAAGAARAWIAALPPFTLFRTDAVPSRTTVVRSLLTRMLAEDRPIVGRAIRGLYWRQPPPVHPSYGRPPASAVRMAQAYLPPGSGLSGPSALEATRWSTQVPVCNTFAVLRRGLTPPDLPGRGTRCVVRSNYRRAELTWHEVTLLEACLAFGLSDCRDWSHAMDNLLECLPVRGGSSPLVRRDAVLWAAETERSRRDPLLAPDSDKGFDAVIRRLGEDLPERLTAVVH